jgi:predicted CoA-binding protein
MAKNTLESIKKFTDKKEYALIGVSRDEKKFSRHVYKELTEKGVKFYPVNPRMDELNGSKVYHSISELPEGVTHALVMTPKAETASSIEEGIKHGLTDFWIQQGAETPEAIEVAKKNNVNVVHKACIMMYSEPVKSIHKFHQVLARLFGAYPRK